MNRRLIPPSFAAACLLLACTITLTTFSACQRRDPRFKLRDAILADDLDRAQTLVHRGVDINEVPIFFSLFAEACLSGSAAMCERLIDLGADVNAQQAFRGEYPIHRAARSGDLAKVQLLRDRGADIDARDEDGETIMFSASQRGHSELIPELVAWGLDVDARDNEGNTPLLALVSNMSDFRRGIRDFNLSLNEDSDRILDEQEEVQRLLATVRVLADCGADMNAVNDNGECALTLVDKDNEPALMSVLIECGARLPGTIESPGTTS